MNKPSNIKARITLPVLVFTMLSWTAAQTIPPHIGYVYPAGGCIGTSFSIIVGGQYLATTTNALISCPGITTKFLEYNRPMPPQQFSELRDRLRLLEQKRQRALRFPNPTNTWTTADEKELMEIRAKLIKNPPNRQATPAISETVSFAITIPSNAVPGRYEIRLIGSNGISNPLPFYIGTLPEFTKPPIRAPNPDLDAFLERLGVPRQQPYFSARIKIPATINGQLLPAGRDRYTFTAPKGQLIVATVDARKLIPYIGDAVPGWCQSTLTIYDENGLELAYTDDFEFDPDPVLAFVTPYDGEYHLEIKDALYRGREDFVYRLTVGIIPFITNIFPLGCQTGKPTTVSIHGWNLGTNNTHIQALFPTANLYKIQITNLGLLSNERFFVASELDELTETEPNDKTATAQPVVPPIIVNGRIQHPNDVDVFKIKTEPGKDLIIEVTARRLGSPLDSLIEILDPHGNIIAANDDYEDKTADLITHHADSYLHICPTTETVYVLITDTQSRGGLHYGYRLKIAPPKPDFTVQIVPSSVTLRAGMNATLTAYVFRRDGFTNAVRLHLEDPPDNFTLHGATIPPATDMIRFTISAPSTPLDDPVPLKIIASAMIGTNTVVRPAIPADEMMQAFSYTHLVPAQHLVAMVLENRRPIAINRLRVETPTPIKLPLGGTTTVQLSPVIPGFLQRFELELDQPPTGIKLVRAEQSSRGIQLCFAADQATAKVGATGNLIVGIYQRLTRQGNATSAASQRQQRRVQISVLPAIPYEVVLPE